MKSKQTWENYHKEYYYKNRAKILAYRAEWYINSGGKYSRAYYQRKKLEKIQLLIPTGNK